MRAYDVQSARPNNSATGVSDRGVSRTVSLRFPGSVPRRIAKLHLDAPKMSLKNKELSCKEPFILHTIVHIQNHLLAPRAGKPRLQIRM